MGSSLCCMKPSQPPLKPRETCTTTITIVTSPARVAIRTRKRVHEEEEAEEKVGVSLKEWLVKSPNINLDHHHAMNASKIQVLDARPPLSQVMSSPEVRITEFYTPRISFSSENVIGKLEKVDERDEDEGDDGFTFTPILKRNGSQKMNKTVSFRKEVDVFFFYSPKETFEDN